MKNIRIIFFYHQLDSLRYFQDRLLRCAKALGVECLVADPQDPASYSSEHLLSFASGGDTVMFTFNQVGIALFGPEGNFWSSNGIPVYDFVVDHPRNYDDILLNPPCEVRVISLDLDNIEFIRRFYPGISTIHFIPNGGTKASEFKPFSQRSMDVMYMGGCQVDTQFYPPINGLPENGASFYRDTIDMMIADPSLTTEGAVDRYFSDRGFSISEANLLKLNLSAAPYIENTVRRHFKLEGMHALDDAGICVDIIGGDSWIDKDKPFSDRIRIHPRISSAELNPRIGDARISLCYTPWYKRGCSEKQFDSMLNGALCLSDRNSYLEKRYTDGKNIVYFDLKDPGKMAADVRWLLDHPHDAENIAMEGCKTASLYDTWENRFDLILEAMRGD